LLVLVNQTGKPIYNEGEINLFIAILLVILIVFSYERKEIKFTNYF